MSMHRLWVHLVWLTRDREPLLTPTTDGVLAARIEAACTAIGCRAVAVGCASDHVHALVQFPPSARNSAIVQHLKAASAKAGSERSVAWHPGYFAESATDVAAVADLVRNQRVRHAASGAPEQWEEAFGS